MLYRFAEFQFDDETLDLLHRGNPVDLGGDAAKALALLIKNRGKILSKDKFLEEVWKDRHVEEGSVHKGVSELRKALGDDPDAPVFIKTERRRGYRFIHPIETVSLGAAELGATPTTIVPGRRVGLAVVTLCIALVIVTIGAIAGYLMYRQKALPPPGQRTDDSSDIELIKAVVRVSQEYESFVLYAHPESFDEQSLDTYWVRDTDPDGKYDRKQIRSGIENLLNRGWHYGDGTECLQFDFQGDPQIDASGTFATVKTLEHWHVSLRDKDGQEQDTREIGPYFVDYFVKLVDGTWLVESSSSGRANKLAPKLSAVVPLTRAVGGREFLVRIDGHDIDPSTVFIKVVGPECPPESPCTVSNTMLRSYAKVSDKVINRVPLTLTSGAFLLTVENGDSSPSNSLPIEVR